MLVIQQRDLIAHWQRTWCVCVGGGGLFSTDLQSRNVREAVVSAAGALHLLKKSQTPERPQRHLQRRAQSGAAASAAKQVRAVAATRRKAPLPLQVCRPVEVLQTFAPNFPDPILRVRARRRATVAREGLALIPKGRGRGIRSHASPQVPEVAAPILGPRTPPARP